ncbi:hypothetical protein CALCODRAFT_155155 [Calocera cornea HHB12733]|uniref:Uncharacterized protein n=1 Tax=Calocera cornea HHB12733 TaxID=1353952 RepID=A0A165CL89_9BASI|nr:hypothetical protein CALCODRAFT_155155 [Calocera cornea HHB12733]
MTCALHRIMGGGTRRRLPRRLRRKHLRWTGPSIALRGPILSLQDLNSDTHCAYSPRQVRDIFGLDCLGRRGQAGCNTVFTHTAQVVRASASSLAAQCRQGMGYRMNMISARCTCTALKSGIWIFENRQNILATGLQVSDHGVVAPQRHTAYSVEGLHMSSFVGRGSFASTRARRG